MATTAARARRRRALDRLVRHHHKEFTELLADEARKDREREEAQMARRPPFFCAEDESHPRSSIDVKPPDPDVQRAHLADVKAILHGARVAS